MPTVTVNLPDRSYDILVEPGSINRTGECIKETGLTGRVALITDANVALHYSEIVQSSLQEAGFEVSAHLIPPGEGSKSMEQVQSLCRSLIEQHHDRGSFVVALGGGVVGDLGGFVAASFLRGVDVVQVPTTVLAQVDASIGGKTAVKSVVSAYQQEIVKLQDTDRTAVAKQEEEEEEEDDEEDEDKLA